MDETTIDMAQYLLLELNRGKLPNGELFLPEEALQARWSGGIKINNKMSYGLGLLRSEEDGLDVARLEKVAGEYESPELGPLVVRQKDGEYWGGV